MPFYVAVGPRGILFRVGTFLTATLGSITYWHACRRRARGPSPALETGRPDL